jgi:hypothetical protein
MQIARCLPLISMLCFAFSSVAFANTPVPPVPPSAPVAPQAPVAPRPDILEGRWAGDCGTPYVSRHRLLDDDWPRAHPFRATTNHPLRLSVLDPIPASATALGPHGRVESSSEYAAILLFDRDTAGRPISQLDSELFRENLSLEGSFASSELDVGLDYSVYHWTGGFLDSFLARYHHAMGLPNGDRDDVPYNQYQNQLVDTAGRTAWSASSGGIRGGNLTVWAKWNLFSGEFHDEPDAYNRDGSHPHSRDSWDIAVRGAVKIPTGSKGAGLNTGGVDYSAGVLATIHPGRFTLDVNLDGVWPGGYDFRGTTDFGIKAYVKVLACAQVALSTTWIAMWQVSGNTAVFTGPPGLQTLTSAAALTTFGAKAIFGYWELALASSEDLSSNGDADFSVIFSVAYEW